MLTPAEVRTFIEDMPEANLLLDNREEFTDARIDLAIELAISTYNVMPPKEAFTLDNFPSKSTLLYGTLAKLFEGSAALHARNTMSYSDGGITLPLEEHYPLYAQLAATFNQLFLSEATRMKVQSNMESGWGEIQSDYSWNPIW